MWQNVHQPVLLDEVIEHLHPMSGGLYIDGTLGLGGHSEKILQCSGPDGKVIGFEWDGQALEKARQRLEVFGSRFEAVAESYANLLPVMLQRGYLKANGLLLDLGVSSLQFDEADRGFSFQQEAPLDMRMSKATKKNAADLLRELSEEQLADIFFYYGEEQQARRIAAMLNKERALQPLLTTKQLAELVGQAIPKKYHPKKIHVATKVFQALRIAVNHELENLVQVLSDAPKVLAKGARICVISFHSLEDRIVKRTFNENNAYTTKMRQPITPGKRELLQNPRARSAKLRVAEITRAA